MKRKVYITRLARPSFVYNLIFLFLISFSISNSSANIVYAQTLTDEDVAALEAGKSLSIPAKIPELEEQISIDVFPESPKPNDDVTITAQTFGVDTNTNLYTWILNGRETLKGIGQNKFTFKVGLTGTVTTVKLHIDPQNGPRVTKDFSYTPVDVDLLWQADTYTPPFYKGKALYTPESDVVFTALPNMLINGRKINPSDIVYRWKIDYKLQNDASGFGKNSFRYKGPIILRKSLIQAEVYSAANPKVRGINGDRLNHINPQVLVYEDHPLLGIMFNKQAKGSYFLSDTEVKFSAFPLHFSTNSKNTTVNYTWKLNGSTLDIPEEQNSAIFRRKNNTEGTSYLSLTIGNNSHILQKSSSGFNILYNNTQTLNAFGSN